MEKGPGLVVDVMAVDPVVVSVDSTLDEADTIIRSTFVIGLPVVDGNGVLVGVIGDAHLAAHRYGRPMPSSEEDSAESSSAR
jgi:CBS domain-containing protein